MPRLRHAATGVVVNVSDATAARLIGYEFAEESEPETPDETPQETSDGPAGYEGLTVVQLKDEIRRRNEGRDEGDRLPLTGDKAELIAALEADDDSNDE